MGGLHDSQVWLYGHDIAGAKVPFVGFDLKGPPVNLHQHHAPDKNEAIQAKTSVQKVFQTSMDSVIWKI